MNNLFIWQLIILIVICVSSKTSTYQNYKYYLERRWGYWNVAIPLAIIIVANIIGIVMSGMIIVFFLIPLDVVFIGDAIFTFFKIRKM